MLSDTRTKGLTVVRMDIQTVVVGGFQMPSLVVLKTPDDDPSDIHLPIRIGPVEATAITEGIERRGRTRPLTHDLVSRVVAELGGRIISVSIVGVSGTTFFATLQLARPDGTHVDIDCRPSDAIALSVRLGIPIYVREQVLDTATMPDFQKVEEDARESDIAAFHDFVENLSPEDFA